MSFTRSADSPSAPEATGLHATAMVLAAGRGERMRPLTDTTPKPLLPVRGKPLMQWSLEALSAGGVTRVLVNTAWLGDQISNHFGPQPAWNGRAPLSILYSDEARDFGGALETAGGIVRALPRLADVFWVAAGDVFAPDFRFSAEALTRFAASSALAHLWLVPNPSHNLAGDFALGEDGRALNAPSGARSPRLTYSTIGLYRKSLFQAPYCDVPAGNPAGVKAALAPILRAAIADGRVSAERYDGAWMDVGTPERLATLSARR